MRWAQVLEAFRGASLPWTVAAIASVPLTMALVTLRWGLLVGAGRRIQRWRVLWDSIVLGQTINILIPLRFGEGARLVVTSRGLDLPVGQVTVGLALERAFDVGAFGTLILMLMAAGSMPDAFAGLLPAAATVTLVTMGAVILFIWLGPASLDWLQRRISLPARAASWIATQEAAIRTGWIGLMRPPQLVMISLLTALIPLAAASTNFLVLKAFDIPVPAIAALVLLVVLQIGTTVVSVPGNIGVFHFLTVATLAAWDIARPAALAAAIVLHAVALGPKLILAALSLFIIGGSVGNNWFRERNLS